MLELLTGRKSCDRYANLKSMISIIHSFAHLFQMSNLLINLVILVLFS